MKIRIGIFNLPLVLVVLITAIFPLNIYGEQRFHVVQRGETFFSISRALGIRSEDLMRYNGITDPTRLQAGMRLRIPNTGEQARPAPVQAAPVQAPAASAATYRVVRGDTLFSIARRFSVTVDALREVNGLSANQVLREGTVLRLPQGANVPQTGTQPATAAQAVGARPITPQGGAIDPSIRWPINARSISYMTGKLSGVAITGTRGEPVYSLTWGTVLSAGPYRGFGRVVIVQAEGGYLFVYGGSEVLSVREGDRVAPGTELGRLGIDALSNQPKLFFMVYRGNVPVDPARAPRA